LQQRFERTQRELQRIRAEKHVLERWPESNLYGRNQHDHLQLQSRHLQYEIAWLEFSPSNDYAKLGFAPSFVVLTPLRVRNEALATQFEAYAEETALHMQNDAEAAAALYLYAASLRNLTRGRDHAETQRAAKRAVELCQRIGQKELAEKLRKSYALDH